MSSSNQAEHDLPSWVALMHRMDEKESESPLALEEEDAFVRTRSYHELVSKKLDFLVQREVSRELQPVFQQLEVFFSNSIPRRRLVVGETGDSEDIPGDSIYDIDESTIFPALGRSHQFRLACLEGPVSALDRRLFVQLLVQKYRRNRQGTQHRTALCHVSNLGNMVSTVHHSGPIVRHILRQCIAQEPSPKSYEGLWKVKNIDESTRLLRWAQRTSSFSEILVFLEDTQSLSAAMFQNFLQALVEISEKLVLKAVLLAPRDESIPLISSSQGQNGILVRHLTLPSSYLLHDRIWTQILTDSSMLPTPLPLGVIHAQRVSFKNHNVSLVSSVQYLKALLVFTFQQEGSFLLGTQDSRLMEQEWRRIAYLCINPEAQGLREYRRSERIWSVVISERTAEVGTIITAVHTLLCKKNGKTLLPIWDIALLLAGFYDKKTWQSVCSTVQAQSKEILFQNVVEAREKIMAAIKEQSKERTDAEKDFFSLLPDATSPESASARLYKALHGLDEIIVLGERGSATGSAVPFEALVIDWIRTAIITIGKENKLWLESLGSSPLRDVTKSINPENRAAIASSLGVSIGEGNNDPTREAPLSIFEAMKGRIDATGAVLLDHMKLSDVPSNEDVTTCALGVYSLIHMGLLVEKRASRKMDVLYEKSSVVWC